MAENAFTKPAAANGIHPRRSMEARSSQAGDCHLTSEHWRTTSDYSATPVSDQGCADRTNGNEARSSRQEESARD